ncbi:hypothetical protein [Microvirga calopogonii]|uniref:hypothetical protein n=1 Tax=Microvirga calopogonii TaxID=2078013 RepID=UPI0013B36F9A|nr:hypothetical protein [Microvirga calopogonii]
MVQGIKERKASDRAETIDVTHWTTKQIAERCLSDGVDAALAMLDGSPEEDDEVHKAALRALGDDDEWDKGYAVLQTVRGSIAVDPGGC